MTRMKDSETVTGGGLEDPPPPGLDTLEHGNLVKLFAGGVKLDAEWRPLKRFKPFTNVFVCDRRQGRILLGMKKRGFGKGLYNGFGGKLEPGESLIEAAQRELQEESGISAPLEECGILLFVDNSTEFCHYTHLYRAYEYEGEPVETEEMHPQWFSIPKEYTPGQANPALKNVPNGNSSVKSTTESELEFLPLGQMWPDVELWMPLLLKGQYFVGRADFEIKDPYDKYGDWVMEKWWFGTKGEAL